MHLFVTLGKSEVRVNVLKSFEALIQNRDGTLDDRAILEAVDVTGMYLLDSFASLRTGTVARDAFAVQNFLLWWTGSHASSVVLQKMFGTFSDARRSVSVLPVGIGFPRVRRRIVLLHGRTLLRTDSIVEEVLAGEAVALFRTDAATGAKKMTTLARIGPEAPALPALRRAVRLGIPLTVLGSLSPASLLATLVALRTGAFGRSEIIHVQVFPTLTRYYFFPVDRFDVAEVVVVVHTHASVENVSEGRHLQIVHLTHRDEQGELDVVDIELEERSSAYNLQSR